MTEIYDCTLREGEQAEGASFSPEGRIELCEELDDFGVDYIELGWPLSSQEIFDSFKFALNKVKNAKIVAFGSTSIKENPEEDYNLNSIVNCGAKYACIFGKTDLNHIRAQLKITSEENLEKIFKSVEFLKKRKITVFYDAEHYFDGFRIDSEYAIKTLIKAIEAGAEKVILCDTNGGIMPDQAKEIVQKTKEELKKKDFNPKLGVHFHDDCGLALANTIACLPYVEQVQGTINGIGERIGNLNFSEFLPIYIKKMKNSSKINLKKLKQINEDAFRHSGLEIPKQRAFVGDTAFAHKGGVHIDAKTKGASYEHEIPEDFGNQSIILLTSLGGRNSVAELAKSFNKSLDKNNQNVSDKMGRLFEELRIYEKKGYRLGALKAEQFLLIDKHFGENKDFLTIKSWKIESEFKDGKETSCFQVVCDLGGEIVEGSACVEGGPINAAYKTLIELLSKKYPEIMKLELIDFHVSIAKKHKEESSVRTEIIFKDENLFSTVGVDINILESALESLEKGFRYYLKTLQRD
jgi:2-isopropylmalate synthase